MPAAYQENGRGTKKKRIVSPGSVRLTSIMPLTTLALIALQAAAPAAPAQPLWSLGVDGVTCLLSRADEIGGKPSLLQIRLDLAKPNAEIEIVAATKTLAEFDRKHPSVGILFGGALATGESYARSAGAGRTLARIRIPVDTIDRMPGGAADIVVTVRDRSITIPAPRLAAALAQLRSCHNGQLRRVGIDPIAWANARLPAIDDGARLVGELYEEVGAMPRRLGDTTVLLGIDKQGHVDSCSVVATPDSTRGAITCQIARERTRAKPAVDDTGKPISGKTLLTVNWTR